MQRVSLRGRQPLGALQRRPAEQLQQTGERELPLRLDPADAREPAAGCPFGDVVEQGRLADAGLAANHERRAPTGTRRVEQAIERAELSLLPRNTVAARSPFIRADDRPRVRLGQGLGTPTEAMRRLRRDAGIDNQSKGH